MTGAAIGQKRDRAEIPDVYKWNLSDIYPSEDAWLAEKTRITGELPALRAFAGRLGSSAAVLADALQLTSRLDKELSRLYVYASMLSDEDTRRRGRRGWSCRCSSSSRRSARRRRSSSPK
jgi:oligoendopeptidase F